VALTSEGSESDFGRVAATAKPSPVAQAKGTVPCLVGSDGCRRGEGGRYWFPHIRRSPGDRGQLIDGSESLAYDQVPMAVIEIFRTIPGPKQSWRPLTVDIDHSHRVRIPGAGFETVDVEVGNHRIGVGGDSQSIEVNVVADRPTQVLVGPGAGGASADQPRLDIKECTDKKDLPRCLIPLNNPGGLRQTLA
jgi:hypothetical protein